jgi:hypothetical protein
VRQTWLAAPLAVLLAILNGGCGYHTAGRGDMLPRTLRTIAIPPFTNITTRYRLTERLPAAITREFMARTRYRVINDPDAADAVLNGAVVSYNAFPVVYDPATGRASTVQVSVHLDLNLRERATGNLLFSGSQMEFRERYEISVDSRAFFDESDSALERVSTDVARTLVSSLLEKF